MSDMVEVVIDSIRVSLISQQRIVILREVDADRYLPIWIGIYEAEAIALALQDVEVARPLTWDLLKNIFSILNARIIRVEVTTLHDDTYYGNIVAEIDGRKLDIDSRPSDAIALAVRAHVPILVSRPILDSVGVIPEEDIQETSKEKDLLTDAPASDINEENLSVFEDFIDNLDIDDDQGDQEDDDSKKKHS
ncbi:MAG: bifunctional nuclease family protein [Anaerolineales bacterium]